MSDINKDQYMRNEFLKRGYKVDKDFICCKVTDTIPFTVIDKSNEFYTYRFKMIYRHIVNDGAEPDFRCMISEDKDKYMNRLFNKQGLKLIHPVRKMYDYALYEIIDSDNQYLIGKIGKIRPSDLKRRIELKNTKGNIKSLLSNEFIKYVDEICTDLDYKVIKYPKTTQDEMVIETRMNNLWKTSLNKICSGFRCPLDTNIPFGERCLIEICKCNHIKYDYQKSMDNGQRMDVYLPKYKIDIEYNGKQHYEDTNRTNLKEENERDLRKYHYCKKSDIKFCEIPFIYDSIDKIVEYVSKKILHADLIRPNDKDIQYSQLCNDMDVINEYKNGLSTVNIGKKLNISETYAVKVLNNGIQLRDHKKPVVQLTKDNKLFNIYESVTSSGYRTSNISAVCRSKYGKKSAYGYKWMYLVDYLSSHPDFTDQDVSNYMVVNN